jgi:small subunit ribosomal protein S16
MLMIRMQRIGRRNDPAFRILVNEKTASPKIGTYTDLLGTYNPKTKALTVAADRLKDWMKKGAQISPSLLNILINQKILEGKKISTLSKKNLEKNVAKKAEEAALAAEAAAKAEAAAAAPVEGPAEEAEPAAVEEAAPEAVAEEAPPEAAAEEAAPAAEAPAA